jgi:hypothetical protein
MGNLKLKKELFFAKWTKNEIALNPIPKTILYNK